MSTKLPHKRGLSEDERSNGSNNCDARTESLLASTVVITSWLCNRSVPNGSIVWNSSDYNADYAASDAAQQAADSVLVLWSAVTQLYNSTNLNLQELVTDGE